MNIDSRDNTAAHEFGHHLGLADRYYEGVTWNQSTGKFGSARDANLLQPIPESRIADPNYTSSDNLYSTGSTTLTDYQSEIANTSQVEKRWQNGIGVFYNLQKGSNVPISKSEYKVGRFRIRNLPIPPRKGQTRKNLIKKIRKIHNSH
ncbi:MAG: hypothetical protein AB8G15_15705 [Saprospiraceae bacterium]